VRDRGKLSAVKVPEGTSFSETRAVEPDHQWESLLDAHIGNWKAEDVEGEIDRIVGSLVIPQKWYDMIYAYFLHDNGLAEFERETYNLRKELERLQRLFTSGYLGHAQFEERAVDITRRLKEHQPSAQIEVKEISPILGDFGSLWNLLNLAEKKALLKVMFVALYFDQVGSIQRFMANSPFDQLLNEHIGFPKTIL
jgi:hypothetical protein